MTENKQRIQGTQELTFDVVRETTNLVQRTHKAASDRVYRRINALAPAPVRSIAEIVRVIGAGTSAGVYTAIRGANFGLRKLLAMRSGLASDTETPPPAHAPGKRAKLVDNAQAALNGFYGDYLNNQENGLALEMSFRLNGKVLPLSKESLREHYPDAGSKICIFVHGLSCTEWSWNTGAEKFHGHADTNFGTLLREELGFTPFYVRYNSGLHISENSRLLSELIAELVRVYPARLDDIVLIGHSMGGLVARGAAAHGNEQGRDSDDAWMRKLRHVFCIGSPHLGAPMEKAVNLLSNVLNRFDTAGTQVPAEVLNSRSSGIKDLRFGYTMDSEWSDQDPDALLDDQREAAVFVDGVDYYFIAATITRDAKNPMGVLLGDLLVRVPSAAGHAPDAARRIPFKSGRIFAGMNHLHLANHPDVYAAIKEWLLGE